MSIRLAFLGTPPAAATILSALVDAGHDVALVVTRPDARRARRAAATPSPVKATALALRLPVSEEPSEVVAHRVDLAVVVAYGRLIKPPLFGALPLINVHFSLLPRWRGAAPVERAILAGDAETGVCLMELEASLDTGPVYARAATGIGPEETADGLVARLAELGADLLVTTLAGPLPVPEPQVGEPTYAAKITTDDLLLRWEHPASDLARIVRAGRAWTTWRGGRLIVHQAHALGEEEVVGRPGELDGDRVATGAGTLRLISVQPEGKAVQAAADWARGARIQPGERLGA